MGIPLRQKLSVGMYILRQRLRGVEKFPVVLELEPLYQCNLACAGCGKIQHPDDILARRLTVEQCVAAVEAIRAARERGFRVFTNTTFFEPDGAPEIRAVLDYLNDEVGVDMMQISPGYAYEHAPDQEHFLGVERTRAIFREAFSGGRRKRWRLNHSPLYLDFLEGRRDFACTPWGIPSYSVLGWQRPCYLMSDAPYARSYRELVDETDWSRYGRGRHPRCENCMAHCGYEPTAVVATLGSLRE